MRTLSAAAKAKAKIKIKTRTKAKVKANEARVPAVARVRRTAQAARDAILDAAEGRLRQSGLAGIRLQEVAADVGVSHPTVLHHFGSRAGLIEAVVERSTRALQDDLVRAIRGGASGEVSIAAMLARVAALLGESGYARMMAWLALEGRGTRPGDPRVRDVAIAAHELRRIHVPPESLPPFEDTYFTVLLGALAMFGDAILGTAVRGEPDTAADARSAAAFRDWLARLLAEHLARGLPAAAC